MPTGPATITPAARYLGGAVFSVTNPFWSLWWVTVGATFMAESHSLGLGALGIAAFYLGHILSDYSWFSLVSLAVASGRRVMSRSVYKGVVLVCGLFLWPWRATFCPRGIARVV